MSTVPEEERRKFSRVSFTSKAYIYQNDTMLEADIVDISLNGVLIHTPEKYHIRTDMPCRVLISLDDDIEIQMNVTLVHTSSRLLGFHCTGIDMDSMSHLRRVIEMNLSDPMAAERVLGELVKNQDSLS